MFLGGWFHILLGFAPISVNRVEPWAERLRETGRGAWRPHLVVPDPRHTSFPTGVSGAALPQVKAAGKHAGSSSSPRALDSGALSAHVKEEEAEV